MTPRRGKQLNLGEGLEKLERALDGKGKASTAARIVGVWCEAVGPQIAGHTGDPVLRSHGELVVAVDSPVWATELAAMSEPLRCKINAALGKEAVRSVRFTVGKLAERPGESASIGTSPHEAEGESPKAGLSDAESEAIAASAAAISDPKLREAAIRATTRHLERSKGTGGRKASQEPREGF